MVKNNDEHKAKKQFWIAFIIFMGIVGLLLLTYLVLSTLNFFG